MSPPAPARRRLVRRFLGNRRIANQQELIDLLADHGHTVTQATVSRDLDAIGAVKSSDPEGSARYVIAADTEGESAAPLGSAIAEFVETISPSGNIVVLTTPPGAAHVVARAIDHADMRGVVGTVAGDDTVLAVADEQLGGERLASALEKIGVGR